MISPVLGQGKPCVQRTKDPSQGPAASNTYSSDLSSPSHILALESNYLADTIRGGPLIHPERPGNPEPCVGLEALTVPQDQGLNCLPMPQAVLSSDSGDYLGLSASAQECDDRERKITSVALPSGNECNTTAVHVVERPYLIPLADDAAAMSEPRSTGGRGQVEVASDGTCRLRDVSGGDEVEPQAQRCDKGILGDILNQAETMKGQSDSDSEKSEHRQTFTGADVLLRSCEKSAFPESYSDREGGHAADPTVSSTSCISEVLTPRSTKHRSVIPSARTESTESELIQAVPSDLSTGMRQLRNIALDGEATSSNTSGDDERPGTNSWIPPKQGIPRITPGDEIQSDRSPVDHGGVSLPAQDMDTDSAGLSAVDLARLYRSKTERYMVEIEGSGVAPTFAGGLTLPLHSPIEVGVTSATGPGDQDNSSGTPALGNVSAVRGRLELVMSRRLRDSAAVTIQSYARTIIARRHYCTLLLRREVVKREAHEAQTRAAVSIQAVFRGHTERRGHNVWMRGIRASGGSISTDNFLSREQVSAPKSRTPYAGPSASLEQERRTPAEPFTTEEDISRGRGRGLSDIQAWNEQSKANNGGDNLPQPCQSFSEENARGATISVPSRRVQDDDGPQVISNISYTVESRQSYRRSSSSYDYTQSSSEDTSRTSSVHDDSPDDHQRHTARSSTASAGSRMDMDNARERSWSKDRLRTEHVQGEIYDGLVSLEDHPQGLDLAGPRTHPDGECCMESRSNQPINEPTERSQNFSRDGSSCCSQRSASSLGVSEMTHEEVPSKRDRHLACLPRDEAFVRGGKHAGLVYGGETRRERRKRESQEGSSKGEESLCTRMRASVTSCRLLKPGDTRMKEALIDDGSVSSHEAPSIDPVGLLMERLKNIRDIVAAQAEASTRVTMAALGTELPRLEATRIRCSSNAFQRASPLK